MQVKTKIPDKNSAYFQADIETMPVEKLKDLQLDRLKKQVKNVYDNNPYFKKVYDDAGFNPADLKTLDDIIQRSRKPSHGWEAGTKYD